MTTLEEIKAPGCEWYWDDTLCRTDYAYETEGLFGLFFKKKVVSYHIHNDVVDKWYECVCPASQNMIECLIYEKRVRKADNNLSYLP